MQRAIATGEPQFVPDVQAEAESMAHDERHARAIHELGNTSGIVVPLAARGRTFGAITFGTVPPQPPFTTRRPRARGRARPPRLGGARQRAPLRGGAGAGARDRGARVRRRRRRPRRPRRDRPAAGTRPRRAPSRSSRPRRSAGAIDDVVRDWQTVRDRTAGAPTPTAGARGARSAAGRRERQRALALDLGRPASPAAPSTRSAT